MFDFLINKKDLDRSILKNVENQGKAKKCSHWALYLKEHSDNSNLSTEHSHGTTNNLVFFWEFQKVSRKMD